MIDSRDALAMASFCRNLSALVSGDETIEQEPPLAMCRQVEAPSATVADRWCLIIGWGLIDQKRGGSEVAARLRDGDTIVNKYWETSINTRKKRSIANA